MRRAKLLFTVVPTWRTFERLPIGSPSSIAVYLHFGAAQSMRSTGTSFSATIAFTRRKNILKLIQAAYRVIRGKELLNFRLSFMQLDQANLTHERLVKPHDALSDKHRQAILTRVATFAERPFLTVLVHTYKTSGVWLRHTVESLRAQPHPEWILCITAGTSIALNVWALLEGCVRLYNHTWALWCAWLDHYLKPKS